MRFKNKVILLLFNIFILVLTIDPGGLFLNIKEPLFFVLVFVGILKFANNGFLFDKKVISVLLCLFACSIYGVVVALLSFDSVDIQFIGAYIRAILFVLIIFYLVTEPLEKIQKALLVSGVILAIITLGIFSTLLFNEALYLQIFEFTKDNQFVLLGKRSFLGLEVNGVYMKAAPLLFFSYIYSLYYYDSKCKFLIRVLLLAAMLVAGSRTPPLLAILITIIYLKDKRIGGVFSSRMVVICAFLFLMMIVYRLASETGEASNDLKYANVHSYIDNISTGFHVLFGAGIGSFFWAEGNRMMLSYTELSYFDLIRMLGVFIGGIYIFALFYIFYIVYFSKYSDTKLKRYSLGYLLYMILAGTNPFLFCPTGTFVIALGLRLIYEITITKKNI